MKVGDQLRVEVESLGFEGTSIARHEGMVIFVEGGLAGDVVDITLRKKKKKYFHAAIDAIVQPSASRLSPVCPHTDDCGGCAWQHCRYDDQLKWKQQHTIDCFERLGKIPFGSVASIIASPEHFHYRNKMEFSFSARRWMSAAEIASGVELKKDFALGLHAPGRYDAVVDVKRCYLQHDDCNSILNLVRTKALELGVLPYSDKEQQGFLRHLVLRRTLHRNQLMVIIISASPRSEADEHFVGWMERELPASLPEPFTLIHAVKDSLSPVAVGEPRILHGDGVISEWSHDVEFRISPFSFFQTNSYQLPNFLDAVFNAAELEPNMHVWDLYCGTGSISLPAARRVDFVTGIELSQQSILDAQHNAELNGLSNVNFIAADLHKRETIDALRAMKQPDLVILDPPRAGVHPMLLDHLLQLNLPRIVYVSCNPATQARDCALLAENYDVVSMQAVDMFPHTFHVENVAVLQRK